jgi:L-cystine uptake protein TcyP (sodium:dicarboxylate symporter family)
VLVSLWIGFARGPADPARLVRYAAACVVAFVALGKVLSPQFLIWLVPLVPLVRGRRGVGASALLAVALVLTQLWFPFRYWDLALRFDELASWLVLVRDLVLVALLGVLAWPRRPGEA